MGRGFLARAGGAQLAALLVVLAALAVAVACTVQAQSAPTVTSVEISTTAGDDDTYALGENIIITVRFSQNVTVTGTPTIKIDMDPADWGEKVVSKTSVIGDLVLFVHKVVEPNYSTQGIAVLANSLALNGGTIRSSGGVDAVLTHTGKDHDPKHKVDWRLAPAPPSNTPRVSPQSVPTATPTATPDPTAPPPMHPTLVVTNISIVETDGESYFGPGPDRVFGLCDAVYIDVTFNNALSVTDPNTRGNVPEVDKITALRLLLSPDSEPVNATHYSGLGKTVKFLWYVGATDYVSDGRTYTCPDGTEEVSHVGIGFPANAVTLGADETWTVPSPAIDHNPNFLVDSNVPNGTSALDLDCEVSTPLIEQVETHELQVSWSIDNGYVFCDAGGWFVDARADGGPWGSHRVPSAGSHRRYRHGSVHGVHYEFRIRAVDVRGLNVAAPDASWITTSEAAGRSLDGGPGVVSLTLEGPGYVKGVWDAANTAYVDSVEGYEFAYRKRDSNTWLVSDREQQFGEVDGDVTSYVQELEHRVHYVFRVCANVTIEGVAQKLCSRQVPMMGVNVPHRIWFIDDSPSLNQNIGRVFMTVDTNYPASSATCNINGGLINCPPNTLVSLTANPGGTYTLEAAGTVGSIHYRCSDRPDLCGGDASAGEVVPFESPAVTEKFHFQYDGGGAVGYFGASGGNGKLAMSWSPVRSQQIGRTFSKGGKTYKTKELDAVIVEYLPPGGEWTSLRVDPSLTEFALFNIPYGTYHVRVRPCMATVEVVNGVETGELHRCFGTKNVASVESNREVKILAGANTNDVDLTVTQEYVSFAHDPGIILGWTSPVVRVTVAPDHTALPKAPTSVTITRVGNSLLKATWHIVPHEGGSEIYDYRLRYRQVGESAWRYILLHAPYDVPCIWSAGAVCGPSGDREIPGVFGSGTYEVEIQSRNANGESAWLRLPNV